MKRVLLLLSLLLANQAIKAQNSSVTVFSDDGHPFYLFLNGIRQNQNQDVNVTVDFLTNGYYNTKIVFADNTIKALEKRTLMVVDVDGNNGDMTYIIKKKKNGNLVLRYYSFTAYHAAPIFQEPVNIIQFNTVPLPPVRILNNQTTLINNTNNIGVNMGINTGDVNIGVNINSNETSTIQTQPDVIVVQELPVLEERCYAMSAVDFSDALTAIEKVTFSDSKVTLAKQIAKANCMTANQIKQTTKSLTYETDKIEFARFAYSYCLNPENYWKVNDAFEFERTIDALNDYIKRQ